MADDIQPSKLQYSSCESRGKVSQAREDEIGTSVQSPERGVAPSCGRFLEVVTVRVIPFLLCSRCRAFGHGAGHPPGSGGGEEKYKELA